MFYLGASLITKALKASSQWKLVPGRRKQIRKLDGKTPIGRLQNTAWNILRIQKFMWFGLNLLQEHLCYYVIYVITGYQRDLIKIRADHATSLHCDIFTSITNKHSSQKRLSETQLWSGPMRALVTQAMCLHISSYECSHWSRPWLGLATERLRDQLTLRR